MPKSDTTILRSLRVPSDLPSRVGVIQPSVSKNDALEQTIAVTYFMGRRLQSGRFQIVFLASADPSYWRGYLECFDSIEPASEPMPPSLVKSLVELLFTSMEDNQKYGSIMITLDGWEQRNWSWQVMPELSYQRRPQMKSQISRMQSKLLKEQSGHQILKDWLRYLDMNNVFGST